MKYYVADAFAEAAFTGNPAGIIFADDWPDVTMMQNIAAQNNLSETAFLVKESRGNYGIRWFTPVSEVDLCGHATLASAFVIMNYAESDLTRVCFSSASGPLAAEKRGDLYALDFPSEKPEPIAIPPEAESALGVCILEAHKSRDLILLLESEEAVKTLSPDFALLAQMPDFPGICVTAQGINADFVSRYFAPLEGIPEDPVTGSAHSALVPFWAECLGKKEMTALQLSGRGGVLYLKDKGGRVEIAGKARLYLSGEIHV